MNRVTHILQLAALAVLLLPGAVRAERFEIVPEASEIVFESSAPMESFTGRTDQVTGWVEADLGNLAGKIDLQVVVDLASFDTGIGKRNQHMRDNHLETDRFPSAVFRGGAVVQSQPASLVPGQLAVLTLQGTLDLHGVRRDRQCDLTVTLTGEGHLRVQGEFPVLLSEHDIERPKFLVLKLADEQKVRIDLTCRRQPAKGQP